MFCFLSVCAGEGRQASTCGQNSSPPCSAKGNGKEVLVAAAGWTLRGGSVPFPLSILQPEGMRLICFAEQSFLVSRRL